MQTLPKRTGLTELSDDELLLFDFLSTHDSVQRVLWQSEYPIHLNVTYSHGLNDAQLLETLAALERRDLVRTFTRTLQRNDTKIESLKFVGLTPAGGQLWELERSPNWNAYCIDSSEDDCVRICSPTLETAERYLDVGMACGLILCDPKCKVVNSMQPAQQEPGIALIPWKKFPIGFEIVVPTLEDSESGQPDWALYHARRSWWRDITELDSLQGLPSK